MCLLCKCLNHFNTFNLLFFLLIIAVFRQSKQKSNSRIHQHMNIGSTLQKMEPTIKKNAALARLFLPWYGNVKEPHSLLSRAGSYKGV